MLTKDVPRRTLTAALWRGLAAKQIPPVAYEGGRLTTVEAGDPRQRLVRVLALATMGRRCSPAANDRDKLLRILHRFIPSGGLTAWSRLAGGEWRGGAQR